MIRRFALLFFYLAAQQQLLAFSCTLKGNAPGIPGTLTGWSISAGDLVVVAIDSNAATKPCSGSGGLGTVSLQTGAGDNFTELTPAGSSTPYVEDSANFDCIMYFYVVATASATTVVVSVGGTGTSVAYDSIDCANGGGTWSLDGSGFKNNGYTTTGSFGANGDQVIAFGSNYYGTLSTNEWTAGTFGAGNNFTLQNFIDAGNGHGNLGLETITATGANAASISTSATQNGSIVGAAFTLSGASSGHGGPVIMIQ